MELTGQKRHNFGKQTKLLRAEGKIPSVVFAKGMESLPVVLSLNQFNKVFDVAGETSLINLKLDDEVLKVLVKEVQVDPITGKPIHVSFYKPNLKEKTTAQIPIEIVGEDENPLIKSGEALVLTLMDEVTAKALPMDLPSKFVVDVSKIANIGDGFLVGQLEYDKAKIELVDVEKDDMIIKLDKAEIEETAEEISEAEALAQMEATEEKAEEEGEGEEKEEKEGKEREEKKETAKEKG